MRLSTIVACALAIFSFTIAEASCPSAIPTLPTLPLPIPAPLPTGACPTSGRPDPDAVEGYLPITFAINAINVENGPTADEIFIVVLVNSSTQYLTFSSIGDGHIGGTITDFTAKTYLSSQTTPHYTYKLSDFENISGNFYTFYIPNDGNTGTPGSNVMQSSRILISLYEPLTYFINSGGGLLEPAEFDVKNDNYFILNDKIEFDLGSNALNRLNLNLTGVDFFGLPMLVQANYQYFYGSSYTPACSVTGMPTTISLADVFTGYAAGTNSLTTTFQTIWNGLVASYTNPTAAGGDVCNLRIYAPATAMGSSQTQSNPTPITFPTNYFLNSVDSPESCTWFNAVLMGGTATEPLAYYENLKPIPYLIVDATTTAGAATAKGYEKSDGSFKFTISGGGDAGKTITFPKPTSSKALFTGAVSDYEPAITGSAGAASQAQILKVFATSIISGLFPINCQFPTPITISSSYLANHPAGYFENNSTLATELTRCTCVSNIPWYDFYSRTLLTIGTPNLFYTSAYSDFLTTDGTIVITDLQGHNAGAQINVYLNDFYTDVNVPNPYGDTTTYNITWGIPSNPAEDPSAIVEYSANGTTGWTSTLPSSAQGNQIYVRVSYVSGVYSGTNYITRVAPAAEIFHPILPLSGNITTSGTSTTISLGGPPAPS